MCIRDRYRAHPDWALQIPGKNPVRSRNQLVLDFSRKDAVDFIFDSITEVLDYAEVEYLKWDMNRSLCDVYSAAAGYQGKVLYDYVLGVYDFLDRLLKRYPNLLIEGCSGGGGRFDAGMLYYTPQIWCSDNTDALDRLQIQYGTSFGFPISAVGSHVSAVPNHQTGRKTPLSTRGAVDVYKRQNQGKTTFTENYREVAEKMLQLLSYGPKDPFAYNYNDACTAFARGEAVMYPIRCV